MVALPKIRLLLPRGPTQPTRADKSRPGPPCLSDLHRTARAAPSRCARYTESPTTRRGAGDGEGTCCEEDRNRGDRGWLCWPRWPRSGRVATRAPRMRYAHRRRHRPPPRCRPRLLSRRRRTIWPTCTSRMMIPHHEQAIEMSDIILAKKGTDPRVVDLATQDQSGPGPRDRADAGLAETGGACR